MPLPSGHGDDMGRNLSEANIFDAGLNTHASNWRRVKVPGSVEEVFEKPPHMLHCKYVDARGNVSFVVLTNASGARRSARNEAHVRAVQEKAGGLRYEECPLRDSEGRFEPTDFPEGMREPCRVKDDRGNRLFGYEGACDHVEHIITERKKKALAVDEERNKVRMKTERRQDEDRAIAREQNELLREIALKSATAPQPETEQKQQELPRKKQ